MARAPNRGAKQILRRRFIQIAVHGILQRVLKNDHGVGFLQGEAQHEPGVGETCMLLPMQSLD